MPQERSGVTMGVTAARDIRMPSTIDLSQPIPQSADRLDVALRLLHVADRQLRAEGYSGDAVDLMQAEVIQLSAMPRESRPRDSRRDDLSLGVVLLLVGTIGVTAPSQSVQTSYVTLVIGFLILASRLADWIVQRKSRHSA